MSQHRPTVYAGDRIEIRGARQHNLKGVDLDLPKGKLIVMTGVSGSGKSSLAFDTLFAEGQRRYVESLSAYARQFLGQMDKPVYDHIRGLSPTIAIDQKAAGSNPRSTVGTITEIHDHLRVLYARAGRQHCHLCGGPVGAQDPAQIVADVLELPEGTQALVLAPIARGKKGTFTDELARALRSGFLRARIDGEIVRIAEDHALEKNKKHDVDLVIDRVRVRASDRQRITDSIEQALREGGGQLLVEVVGAPEGLAVDAMPWQHRHFSEKLWCPKDDVGFAPLTPARFSFNTPQGACPTCNGLGQALEMDPARVVPDDSRSVRGGAIVPWASQADPKAWTGRILDALAAEEGIDLDKPWRELPEKHRRMLLDGDGEREVTVRLDGKRGKGTWKMRFEGALPQLERRWAETQSGQMRDYYAQFFVERRCPACDGARLRPESAAVRVGGQTIVALSHQPVDELRDWFEALELQGNRAVIAAELVKEIRGRLGFLCDVGLGYLSLDRTGNTLSGGEAQRIRLASQVGSELTGVLYILDEPSIGLHPRDTERLTRTLLHLRDIGNTVLVVEHDESTIRAADHLVDFGPGAGVHGGEVVASGPRAAIEAAERSLTGAYLSGRRRIELPKARRPGSGELWLRGADGNNLRDIDVRVPTGALTVVTGVSGAGKSTLIGETLLPAALRALGQQADEPAPHRAIEGLDAFDKVIEVDQRPIGRTPRSNPATYTKIFDKIRELFATLPEAKMAGYGPGRFSFNVKGGRCEACKGDGVLKIEMHFLADVYVPCEVCGGRRFNESTLAVRYKDKSIADVLDLTVDEALELFALHKPVARALQTLTEVGLGYMRLGQTATTLSGGEAQRIKLSRELARVGSGRTLYVLDEPTTGLHFEDVRRLIAVLQRLCDKGNTVLVVEHDLDLVKVADWVIDLGPEGGVAGGELVTMGTPEDVAAHPTSFTGAALRPLLGEGIAVGKRGRGRTPS
ncbi:MAG: hypothetical protein RIT45_3982 [Pseudomonadota bacterium]